MEILKVEWGTPEKKLVHLSRSARVAGCIRLVSSTVECYCKCWSMYHIIPVTVFSENYLAALFVCVFFLANKRLRTMGM